MKTPIKELVSVIQMITTRKVLEYLTIGFLFGLIMVGPITLVLPLSSSTFDILNAPAFWLSYRWIYSFDLPPHGYAIWTAVPMAILLQWSVLGLLIGFCCSLISRWTPIKPRARKPSAPPELIKRTETHAC